MASLRDVIVCVVFFGAAAHGRQSPLHDSHAAIASHPPLINQHRVADEPWVYIRRVNHTFHISKRSI
jgi:hypothetical protein